LVISPGRGIPKGIGELFYQEETPFKKFKEFIGTPNLTFLGPNWREKGSWD